MKIKPEEMKKRLTEEYRMKFANPYIGAARGYINSVIEPKETRPKLIKVLKYLNRKREPRQSRFPRKHGNMPM